MARESLSVAKVVGLVAGGVMLLSCVLFGSCFACGMCTSTSGLPPPPAQPAPSTSVVPMPFRTGTPVAQQEPPKPPPPASTPTPTLSAEDQAVALECFRLLSEARSQTPAAEERVMERCARRMNVTRARADSAYVAWVAAGMPRVGTAAPGPRGHAPPGARTRESRIGVPAVLGCVSRAARERATEIAARGGDPRRASGCVHLPEGTPVEIVGTAGPLASELQVIDGRSGRGYWVATEDVER